MEADMRDRAAHESDPGRDVILVFPSGSQFVRSNLRALERAGMLATFCTTLTWPSGARWLGMLPHSFTELLRSRMFEEVDAARIRTFPLRELVHQAARRVGLSSLTRHETGWASFDGVSQALDAAVARLIRSGKATGAAVYAYEYVAQRSFAAARAAGMRCFYELQIGYWRAGLRILQEESAINPDWSPTIELLRDSRAKQERKDAELEAADHVLVPSSFVRDTLSEHPGFGASIDVVPYGAPPPRPAALQNRTKSPRLRLLYVGHLSQRKGISYLFAAMRRLQGIATLTLVGPRIGTACPALEAELARHRWLGAVPHGRVLDIMGEHDVFVLPSLFEGFAQVVLEAMAQGVPAIATPNSGAADAIADGHDGFVVPIRDADAIAARVEMLAGDRDRVMAMSEAALQKAAQRSWSAREEAFVRLMRVRLDERVS